MRFKKEDKDKDRVLSPIISHIAEGTVIEGDINCEQELLISGTVKGNIRCGKKLVVAQNGRVFGNVHCLAVTVIGSIEGDINSSGLLVLESQSVVLGKITSLLMEVHAGAKIESQVCAGKADTVSQPKEGKNKLLALEIKELEAVH